MPEFEAVIGLEIHAQLLTASKIFCSCSTAFGAAPNTQVCPVCLGLPGPLPVLNREAVDLAIRAALALDCRINESSVFARKNYFYPDLPKGYQISQYERPLATGGALTAVGITRVHLEEDAGKSIHEGFADSDRKTYVDFNRSGVPLIEIVTAPDLRSAADAAIFFSRLREILVWLGVNDGNMEEGSLRCDANVSVRRAGETTLGTKAEVKNLNSFRFLEKALDHEIERQIGIVRSGARVVQETRLWDPAAGHTVSMRSKEEAHDYRYFPEPDLPPLIADAARVERIRAEMPELPEGRRRRFVDRYALPSDYFEAVVAAGTSPKVAGNWIINIAGSTLPIERLTGLLALVEQNVISSSIAKTVLDMMIVSGRNADEIVAAQNLGQIDDEAQIARLVAEVLSKNASAVAQYRGGKSNAFGFLVGQVMKAAGGKANPKRVNEILKRTLEIP